MKSCTVKDCGRLAITRGLCKRHYRRALIYGNPVAGRTLNGESQTWLEQHKNFSGSECLIWPFSRNAKGYGQIRVGSRMLRVHRIMCEHRHGPPPTPEHAAAHNCGKGHLGCVNQWHLDWKTLKENCADRLHHETHQRGEKSCNAKLTATDVIAIRSATGVSGQKLAKLYGVSRGAIYHIRKRLNWAWL